MNPSLKLGWKCDMVGFKYEHLNTQPFLEEAASCRKRPRLGN